MQAGRPEFKLVYGATHIPSLLCREHITPTPVFPWEISPPPESMPVFLCLDAAGRLAIAGVDNSNELHSKINEMQNNA